MECKFCGRHGIHLCRERIQAYHDSLTPEQRAAQTADRMASLERAIEAGKVLKEKYGIELVCSA